MIINGDCYEEILKLKSGSIDLILIDPPYFISKVSRFTTMHEDTPDIVFNKYHNLSNDFGEWDKGKIDWLSLFKEFYRILKKGGTILLFYDVWKSSEIKTAATINKFKQPRIGSWVKCIAGSSELYVRNSKGEHKKMFLKDIHRHTNFSGLELWGGEKWNTINNIIENKEPYNTLKITLESGEVIKSTSDHIFITEDNKEVYASDLNIGDILKYSNLPESDTSNSFSMISDEMMWFIGLYLAEGSMSNRKMQISSHVDEIDRIEKISELCSQYDGKFYTFIKENTKSMTINVSSPIIESIVNKFINGRDCYTKSFSNDFFNLPNKLISIAFFSYMNADCGKDLKNNRYKIGFTGKNRQLERDIRTICNRLGFRVNMKLTKIRNTNTGKLHSCIKGSVYLKDGNTFIPNRIASIEKNGIEKTKYFDIMLNDSPNLFSLSSGVLLHNCNPVPVNSNINYLSNAVEYFFTFVKSGKPTFNSKYDKGIYNYPLCHGNERLDHPTQKPLELIKELISKHSNEGDLILDCFAGTGTTGHAAKLLNRNYILIEKDINYYNIALNRLNK